MIFILRIQIKIIIERKQFKTNKRRDFRSSANFEEKKKIFQQKQNNNKEKQQKSQNNC